MSDVLGLFTSILLTIARIATQHCGSRCQVTGGRILEAVAQVIVVADEEMRRALRGGLFP